MTHQHKFNLRKRQPKQQTAPTSGSKNNSAANDTASGSTQRKTSGVNDQLDPGWLSEQPNTTKKNNKGKGKQLFRAENGQTESISEQAIKNLEEKVDTVISYLRQYEERIVTLEKSPHHSDKSRRSLNLLETFLYFFLFYLSIFIIVLTNIY